MLSNVECIFLKPACEREIRLTSSANEFNKNGMNGKCFNVSKSMYQHIKSCVTKNGVNSDFFSCSIGVRQGENLSPFLFAVFNGFSFTQVNFKFP
jgi:hypothetical protein